METEQQLPPYGSFYYGYLLDLFIAIDRQVETLTRLDITRVRNYEAQGFWLYKSEVLGELPPLTALHSLVDNDILYALMQTIGRGEWIE